MFLRRSFLPTILTTVCLTIAIQAAEEQPYTVPSLVDLCRSSFATDITPSLTALEEGITDPSHFLHAALHDEGSFYSLMTIQDKDKGYTPLHHAASKDSMSVQRLLRIYKQQEDYFNAQRKKENYDEPYPSLSQFIDLRSNIDANGITLTPLVRAITYKKFDIADVLIEQGAKLDTVITTQHPDGFFHSPLLNHVTQLHAATAIKYLLERGISIKNSIANDSVYVSCDDTDQIVELVDDQQWVRVLDHEKYGTREKEGHVLLLNPYGEEALSAFIATSSDIPYEQSAQIMHMLFERMNEESPEEYHTILKKIFEDSIEYDNNNTLMLALRFAPNLTKQYPLALIDVLRIQLPHSIDMANTLITNGAITDVADGQGNTPLHWAAFRGYFETVRRLVNCNAPINRVNHNDETPLDVTKNANRSPQHTAIAHFLRSNNARTGRQVRHRNLRKR